MPRDRNGEFEPQVIKKHQNDISVMNELKTRGVDTILIFCTENLRGIDDAIKSCYPESDYQNV